jgi:hypothetical protein
MHLLDFGTVPTVWCLFIFSSSFYFTCVIIPLQCHEKQLRVSITSVSLHLASETLVCSFTRFCVPKKQEALQFVHNSSKIQ